MSVQHPVACVIEVCIGTGNATLLIYYPLLEDVILLRHVSIRFCTIFRQYTYTKFIIPTTTRTIASTPYITKKISGKLTAQESRRQKHNNKKKTFKKKISVDDNQ
jgi:hypothetical protein